MAGAELSAPSPLKGSTHIALHVATQSARQSESAFHIASDRIRACAIALPCARSFSIALHCASHLQSELTYADHYGGIFKGRMR